MSAALDILVSRTLSPARIDQVLGVSGDPDRKRDLVADDVVAEQVEEDEQRLAVGEHVAGVVDDREVLAVGVDGRPEVGPRGPHQRRHLVGVGRLVVADQAAGRRVRVHREHVGTHLGQHVRHDEGRRAVAVVDDHLEAGALDQVDVDGRFEGGGVLLEGAGRVDDVADLAGQDPAEVLPREHPLELALARLGQVEALVVEEPDDHRLRIALDQPHGACHRRRSAGGRRTG